MKVKTKRSFQSYLCVNQIIVSLVGRFSKTEDLSQILLEAMFDNKYYCDDSVSEGQHFNIYAYTESWDKQVPSKRSSRYVKLNNPFKDDVFHQGRYWSKHLNQCEGTQFIYSALEYFLLLWLVKKGFWKNANVKNGVITVSLDAAYALSPKTGFVVEFSFEDFINYRIVIPRKTKPTKVTKRLVGQTLAVEVSKGSETKTFAAGLTQKFASPIKSSPGQSSTSPPLNGAIAKRVAKGQGVGRRTMSSSVQSSSNFEGFIR